jgi:dihydropteroate synthase
VRRAEELAAEGADLVDIGAESTRPGAPPVSVEEEWSRLEPVLSRLQGSLPVPISVDTTKAEVAARALELGAAVINDVSGLQAEPAIAGLAAETGAGLIVMHMRGDPRTMQRDVEYEDLIGEIRASLAESLSASGSRQREAFACWPGWASFAPWAGRSWWVRHVSRSSAGCCSCP